MNALTGLSRNKARTAAVAGGAAAAAGALWGAGFLSAAVVVARRVVTPETDKQDDTEILAFDDETVTLRATGDNTVPGIYGLFLEGGAGHIRVGQVTSRDEKAGTVTRTLLGVDRGELDTGPARWSGYYFAGSPGEALGVPCDDVHVPSAVGDLPAWHVPPEDGSSNRWAILIHGRSANREETMRAIPVLRRTGWTTLVPTYRNDVGAPPSKDQLYGLGLTEWHDVHSAIEYALAHGAQEVALLGWSMGGAIVLQTLDRSPHAARVSRAVLDAPVIDWQDVLRHQAGLNRVPAAVLRMATRLFVQPVSKYLIGNSDPIDLAVADWVTRAQELRHPVLLIHSDADDVVPIGPSRALAKARPDLVRFVPWLHAKHVKEWNVDRDRWEQTVAAFMA